MSLEGPAEGSILAFLACASRVVMGFIAAWLLFLFGRAAGVRRETWWAHWAQGTRQGHIQAFPLMYLLHKAHHVNLPGYSGSKAGVCAGLLWP